MRIVQVTPWHREKPPTEAELRTMLQRERLSAYTWSNRAFDEYAPHSHAYDKVIYVVSGSITWILPETNHRLLTRAGDRLDLPRGVVHAAKVGAEGVMCLEAHR